ncbi:unnamed protein product [Arabidopsis arenosa]|uniref:Uncharacterized protein n=1 Tax=Arabidopsis arenosa TaxID=38785 RepID=A0A8S2APQ6_ARAAE|nr:unnamed protein product [Arabidopsis arenosa]
MLNPSGNASEEFSYKILIYDEFCKNILAPLFHVKDLLKQRVTLRLLIDKIDKDRKVENECDISPAVYFVQPTESNIQRIISLSDPSISIHSTFDLNFSSYIPRPLLEVLASGTLNSGSNERIETVHDQYLEFVTLEDNLFSLAQHSTYVQLNDPSASDRDIEEIIEKVADGLFCVLVTLSVVPVIRSAEMVASALDQKLRDHLLSDNNLFNEGGGGGFLRPEKKSIELNSFDPFWSANSFVEFPEVGVEVETQLNKYKKDVEEVKMRTGGGESSSADFDGSGLIGSTKHLMNAVNSLPELVAKSTQLEGEKVQKEVEVQKLMEQNVKLTALLDKKEAQLLALNEQCKIMALNARTSDSASFISWQKRRSSRCNPWT